MGQIRGIWGWIPSALLAKLRQQERAGFPICFNWGYDKILLKGDIKAQTGDK
jgi:hypothetical protein